MRFKQYLKEQEKNQNMFNEVRHIGKGISDGPLKDDETITVYHGFNSFLDAAIATKYGLSGKVKAKRVYSPESNNNPKGLFVSPSFKIAKKFATCGVVIEFNVKVGQLEAPVWPKGSYAIQGQMASYFKDDEEREKKRSEMRDAHKVSDDKNVAKSDRPELSATLAKMAEKQALYVGDLNPNMIRAVWYNETLHKNNRINGPWDRITVKDFYKLVPEKTFKYKSK